MLASRPQPARPKTTLIGGRRSLEAMPESDPAYPIVSGILGIVPASCWTFALVASSGDLVSHFGSHANGRGLAWLASELRRQRAECPNGPRIAATLASLDGFESGVTLVFADARTLFGILAILRTADWGSFTSSEITILTLALHSFSDRLSALRLQLPQESPAEPGDSEMGDTAERSEQAFYVLDGDLKIVLASGSEDQRRLALTGMHTRIAERLPVVLEETVRELTASWSTGSIKQSGLARPVPFLVVQTRPMFGPAGLFTGVRIDRFQSPNSLTSAAGRFHFSPREVQVLGLLLDGKHLDQIARQLYITSSTVQDHIKSMVDKTQSRNRTELIARVLGWKSTLSSVAPMRVPRATRPAARFANKAPFN
jgi:DNA-binding CsgD family transcriptional regulator